MLDTISSFIWSEDNVALLRARYEAGVSAGKIADEFGHGCTRNAVIGKVHRLGLTRDVTNVAGRPRNDGAAKKPVARAAAPKPEIRPVPAKVAVAPVQRPPSRPPAPVPRPICETVPVPSNGILIHELEPRHCRWPVIEVPAGRGDEMRYCGAARVPQGPNDPWRPYCPAHTRMAYAPRRSERERAADVRRGQVQLQRRGAA